MGRTRAPCLFVFVSHLSVSRSAPCPSTILISTPVCTLSSGMFTVISPLLITASLSGGKGAGGDAGSCCPGVGAAGAQFTVVFKVTTNFSVLLGSAGTAYGEGGSASGLWTNDGLVAAAAGGGAGGTANLAGGAAGAHRAAHTTPSRLEHGGLASGEECAIRAHHRRRCCHDTYSGGRGRGGHAFLGGPPHRWLFLVTAAA
jgi:hypothetical protein